MTQPVASPQPDVVNSFHAKSDVNTSSTAQHHTLGIDANQASPGNHKHDGKSSKLLGEDFDPTFPTTANAAYVQADFQKVINALRNLGYGS